MDQRKKFSVPATCGHFMNSKKKKRKADSGHQFSWPAVSRSGRFFRGFISVLGSVADILVSHSSAFHSAFGHLPILSRVPIILHHVWKCQNTFWRSGKISGDNNNRWFLMDAAASRCDCDQSPGVFIIKQAKP